MFLRRFVRDGLIILAIPLVSASSVHDGRATTSEPRLAPSPSREDSRPITGRAYYAPFITEPESSNPPGSPEKRGRTDSTPDLSNAERLFSAAVELLKEERVESSRSAIEKFKESLPLWRTAGDRRQEALTLKRIGDAHVPLGEYQNALNFYNQAIGLNRSTGDRKGEAETLNEIGYVHLNLGENQRALTITNQSLRLARAAGTQRGIARAQNNLGEIHYGLGDLQQSLRYFEVALDLWRGLDDPGGQALALLNSGYVYSDLGQVRQAFTFYEQAMSLWESAQDQRGQALTLTAIGRLYSRIGESQEALDFFQRAKTLISPIGDPISEAYVLNGLAFIYNGLGESQRALEYYDRSLTLCRTAEYRFGEATTLGEVGRVYFSRGDHAKSLQNHESALNIFRAIGDRRMEIVEMKEIAKVYDARGDKRKALEFYDRARSSYRHEKGLRGEADILNLIGRIHADWGQKQTAMNYFAQALSLSRKAEYPLGETAALNNLARSERDNGNLPAARERTEEALRIIESQRDKVNSADLRSSYFASVRQQHEFHVDLLMQMHKQNPAARFDVAAFDASERARARSFLELFAAARVGVRDQADPMLLERERQLNNRFRETANRRGKLAQEAGAASVEVSKLTKEIDELVWQLREVEAEIRANTMRDPMLLRTQPFHLMDIQQRVLDDESVLLEYMLGAERSYVWVITRSEVTTFELAPSGSIEAAARRYRELLTAQQPVADENFQQRQARILEADAQIPKAADVLSDLVIAPVLHKLGTKRIIIVADGALHYIPFPALTVPSRSREGFAAGERVPLLLDHEIVYVPSASALAYVRDDYARREARNSIAVFADPVFEADDSRVTANRASGSSSAPEQSASFGQVFRDSGLSDGRIPALPASRDEANAIMTFAPWGTGLKALGFDANRAAVTNPELAQYRIVHFATHGFVDYDRPELSGLALSQVDQNGNPQDGFLRLHDIYNLKLSADLVVLSACNTGLGKEIKGEGLVGLTRGFMYAGAGGVAASLWKVDDEATAELMTRFYEGMFRRGLTPSAAMREAQLSMWREKRWRAPYHWAAFIIQGRYDQKLNFNSSSSRAQWSVISAGLASALVLATFLVFPRRRTRPV